MIANPWWASYHTYVFAIFLTGYQSVQTGLSCDTNVPPPPLPSCLHVCHFHSPMEDIWPKILCMPLAKSRENNVHVCVWSCPGWLHTSVFCSCSKKRGKKFVITKYTFINDEHYRIKTLSVYDAEQWCHSLCSIVTFHPITSPLNHPIEQGSERWLNLRQVRVRVGPWSELVLNCHLRDK